MWCWAVATSLADPATAGPIFEWCKIFSPTTFEKVLDEQNACDETPHWPHRPHRQEITLTLTLTLVQSSAAAIMLEVVI